MIKIRDGELAASLTDSIPQLETDSVRMERDSYVLVLWIEDPVITAYGILKKESVKVENGKRIERETVDDIEDTFWNWVSSSCIFIYSVAIVVI